MDPTIGTYIHRPTFNQLHNRGFSVGNRTIILISSIIDTDMNIVYKSET
jgi:hypothetical protein